MLKKICLMCYLTLFVSQSTKSYNFGMDSGKIINSLKTYTPLVKRTRWLLHIVPMTGQ